MRLAMSGEVPKVMMTSALLVRSTGASDRRRNGERPEISRRVGCRGFAPQAWARKLNFDACDPITASGEFMRTARPVIDRSRFAPNVMAVPPEASSLREKFDGRHMCYPEICRLPVIFTAPLLTSYRCTNLKPLAGGICDSHYILLQQID